MESEIFKKMKVKSGTNGIYLYAPEEFIEMAKNQDYINFTGDNADLVILFVSSQEEFHTRINEAIALMKETTVVWIAYPKSTSKEKYDINRTSIFNSAPEYGVTPCAQVAFDNKWSALRIKKL